MRCSLRRPCAIARCSVRMSASRSSVNRIMSQPFSMISGRCASRGDQLVRPPICVASDVITPLNPNLPRSRWMFRGREIDAGR